MLNIERIGDYLKILTDREVKYFVVINFGEYFKSIKKYFLNFARNKILAEFLYIFLTTPAVVEKYAKMNQSSFYDNCVHRYNAVMFLMQNHN